MHHLKYFLPVGIVITLACTALVSPPMTPKSVPTVDNALEIPSATPVLALIADDSFEIPNATIEYYDVSGSTEWEIRENLNALSPMDENGFRGDALTRWEIRWNWDGYGTETCDLDSVTASYHNTVRLPRWTPPPNAPLELIKKWNDYMFALVEHEKGHVDLVVDYFPDVIEAIQGATCDTAEARAQNVLSQLRRDHLSYDEETNHGGAQGAIFP